MGTTATEDVHTIGKIAIGKAQANLEETPTEPFLPPQASGSYKVDERVVADAYNYGESLWGKTAKLVVRLPTEENDNYFLKVVTLGEIGRHMCEGEYESLKAIYAISPSFVPQPYAWGKLEGADETYFLLAAFRDVGEQPADPVKLAAGLADMHQRSVSPTGKFGFHFSTCHARIAQAVDTWEDSWCTLYGRHLGHVMELAKPILNWPEFDVVCDLTLQKVVPRLLLPLQAEGRVIKPCLIHGDCWDGNTAMDAKTGEAFVFDVCSFYGHNEYDTGNWRAPRHRLSSKAYIRAYKRNFPVSEPVEDWDARNLLYSLTFNIGNTIYIPGSQQREVVYDDMTTLCKLFCPAELKTAMDKLARDAAGVKSLQSGRARIDEVVGGPEAGAQEEEEEEEELPL
ncbi:uncharacterized protein J4E84_009805 [Alternaria hordeiaustralica]|uniref:uncharacterized protein n=1 Tax=Alternaria hordeiaustralica TaxID=1187925 RepID=UPI0020C213B9|nr:uncharacterized protein J4E84_009805 [Alternaria hordeiaustralica]KAI4676006.1 hypothetical protein J4E84_009805 [Alternaria hordeiaustralica]